MFDKPADEFKGNLGWALRTIKIEMDVLNMKEEHRDMICFENGKECSSCSL